MTLNPKIAIVGLGYVGLPLAVALCRNFGVIGYDKNPKRIVELKSGTDRTGEISTVALNASEIEFTDNPDEISQADIFIIAVPTPVSTGNEPDLAPLISATESVGAVIRPGAVVVFESTVYPGVTEDICGPVLERVSGMTCGADFFLGYSPERINPGDSEHTIDRIVKVVAGQTEEVSGRLAQIYGSMNSGQIFIARDIRTAEAAKVIENAQRDINIAFMNEIAQIFGRLGISTYDVLEAAGTKWNFLPFSPGLVGGHCIGVDPYYLAHAATAVGVNPMVVLSGRSTNDGMAAYVADQIAEQLKAPSRILMLGLTFKENVPDLRNSKVPQIVDRLRLAGHTVVVSDPLADPAETKAAYDIELATETGSDFDCVVSCVAHREYIDFPIPDALKNGGLIADLKGIWRGFLSTDTYRYWSL